ncbi:uncharacterized protein [Argopecten irradians]|uniref:uncharacterized protein n=1 Tax=Argopecten irradians TaxID=31199 RepID=UPI0037194A85
MGWKTIRTQFILVHPILAVTLVSLLGLLLQIINFAMKQEMSRKPSIWDSDGNVHSFLIPTDELNSSDIKYLSYRTSYSYPPEEGNLSLMVKDSLSQDKAIPLKVINTHPFSYIHLPVACNYSDRSENNIVVLIKSFALNYGFREAQRTLWNKMNRTSMSMVFMLGYHSLSTQRMINMEALRYHDIIQEDFIDAYFNNTYKTIMAYNWAVRYCPGAKMLLFQDDDYHVDWYNVSTYMTSQFRNNNRNVYCGSLAPDAPPYRKEDAKWFLTFKDYPFDLFPPYIGGGSYVVSFDVAKRFQRAFPYVRYLGIDDVYLGIVSQKLDIKPKNETLLDTVNRDSLAKECSHIADNIVNEKCDLADKKREIFELSLQTTTAAPEVLMIDGQLVDVDDIVYLSYDEEFAYPLKVRLDDAVKNAVLYNNKIPFTPINVHKFLTLNEPPKCSNHLQSGHHIFLLILIKVNASNFKIRDEIRQFWKSIGDSAVKIIFLLGKSTKSQMEIDQESFKHKDILQENFKEHFMHSTRKIEMGFNWLDANCPRPELVMVLEDMYQVNYTQMMKHLKRIPKNKEVFIGKLWRNMIPHRERNSKWRLSYGHYPFDKFPPYLSGGAFVASYGVVRKFKIAFPYVKYFGIDDVYLGIIAKKIRIIPIHDSYFEPLSTVALVKRCPRDVFKIVNGRCIDKTVSQSSSGSYNNAKSNIVIHCYIFQFLLLFTIPVKLHFS